MQIPEIIEDKRETTPSSQKNRAKIYCPMCRRLLGEFPLGVTWRLCSDENGLHIIGIIKKEKYLKVELVSE